MSDFWFQMGVGMVWIMSLGLGVATGTLAFMALRFILVEDENATG